MSPLGHHAARSTRVSISLRSAQSAPAALQRISDATDVSIILILSDVNMPGMSGLDMLPKAKAVRPDVPIIMITAYGDAETKRKALEGGAEALASCPLYPQKQTFAVHKPMSALGQKRTFVRRADAN